MQNRRSFLQTSAAMFAALGVRLDFGASVPRPVDLSPFCDTDTGMWDLTRPWTCGGYRYASNHHMMARVPTGDPDDVHLVGKVLRRADESRVPNIANLSHRFQWDRCESASSPWPERSRQFGLGLCPDHHVSTRVCAKCVNDDQELRDFCERCFGLGEIATTPCVTCGEQDLQNEYFWRPCMQPIGDGLVVAEKYDDLIRGLPNVAWANSVCCPGDDSDLPICFRFDGGQGLVMPVMPPDPHDADRHKHLAR